jgi:hypothetical protein
MKFRNGHGVVDAGQFDGTLDHAQKLGLWIDEIRADGKITFKLRGRSTPVSRNDWVVDRPNGTATERAIFSPENFHFAHEFDRAAEKEADYQAFLSAARAHMI